MLPLSEDTEASIMKITIATIHDKKETAFRIKATLASD